MLNSGEKKLNFSSILVLKIRLNYYFSMEKRRTLFNVNKRLYWLVLILQSLPTENKPQVAFASVESVRSFISL